MDIRTLADLVFHIRKISVGRPDLLSFKRPQKREALSAVDFLRNIHSLTLALEARGLTPGDRVAIYSESRPEWHMVDFACQLLGVVTVPLDPALSMEQLGFILRNSDSRWVFYNGEKERQNLEEIRSSLATAPEAVAFEGDAALPGGLSMTRLMGEGAPYLGEKPIERFRNQASEGDLASLVYSIGATGDPKGVMLTHGDLVASFMACDELLALGPRDVTVSLLPLAMRIPRTIDHLCFYCGVGLRYVSGGELVAQELREQQPTLLMALPQVYEDVYRRLMVDWGQERAFKKRQFDWAVNVGKKYAKAPRNGFAGLVLTFQYQLAEILILRKIQARLGGRLKFGICGGPLATEVSEFFEGVGVPLLNYAGEIGELIRPN